MQRFIGFLGIFAIASMLTTTGCATIVSGTTQKLSVTSQPSDATAKVDNNLSAKTPTIFTLDRKHDHTIEISKDGYKTATVLIKRTVNGAAFGNVLLGGVIGAGIDIASGANSKLVPERVDIILELGEGVSTKPQFVAEKDQAFYDNQILKAKKSTDPAVPTRDAELAASQEAVAVSVAPASAISNSNFGPKVG